MKYSRQDALAWIDDELAELDAKGLRRHLQVRDSATAHGSFAADHGLVNFGSNDYLGLATDARLVAAAARAANESGWGAGASPLITGHTRWHEQLCRRLAEFEGAEAALLFSSGYAANQGAICALAGGDDVIFADAKNHASMIDGCRLSRARVVIYPHNDATALAALLSSSPAYRRRLIVTESLFSMDGDLAPLAALSDLADAHGCMLLVDEAHATGVFGEQGRGLAEQLGICERISVRVGTLSKALGSVGGFVCGSQSLVEWLTNRARPYVFSTAMPPAACAAALAALEIVQSEPKRRHELRKRSQALAIALREQGWHVRGSQSQIIPLVVGDARRAVQLSERLGESGLLVPAIRPPSVAPEGSLLRVSVSYAHTAAMVDRLVAALAALAAEVASPPTIDTSHAAGLVT